MQGRVFKYGDHINTDLIIPARYLTKSDEDTLRSHCMEDLDAGFVGSVERGDFIVAGRNFGCGSSREHAPIAIKASGIACVIAHSFARIFFRNSINIGLPVLECEEAAHDTGTGDVLSIELSGGVIENLTRGKTYLAQPFPPFMERLIACGGLVNYVKSGGGA